MSKRLTTEQLEAIRKRVEEAREYGHGVGVIVFGDVPDLLAEVARLRTALEFYADESNNHYFADYPDSYLTESKVMEDDGNIAREAIRND